MYAIIIQTSNEGDGIVAFRGSEHVDFRRQGTVLCLHRERIYC